MIITLKNRWTFYCPLIWNVLNYTNFIIFFSTKLQLLYSQLIVLGFNVPHILQRSIFFITWLKLFAKGLNISWRVLIILKIILFAAIFELMFKHNNPKKVIISEYILASEFFLEKVQIGYLNAILDKISKVIRKGE